MFHCICALIWGAGISEGLQHRLRRGLGAGAAAASPRPLVSPGAPGKALLGKAPVSLHLPFVFVLFFLPLSRQKLGSPLEFCSVLILIHQ